MDVTQFVATHRQALLIGDYNAYRAQLSRQLRATRKRLGRATPKREKFTPKPITAEDIGGNHAFAHLFLLTSERAWAHAMHIKTSHADDSSGKGITGPTRSQMYSRLAKAAKVAQELSDHLKNRNASKTTERDVLEVRAYLACMKGAEAFEKQPNEEILEECLRNYSEARVIYAALLEEQKTEVYRDILADRVDPTIRYAAYQAHLPRTIAIPTVAKRYFPKDDVELVKAVEKLDPYALKEKPVTKSADDKQTSSSQEVPNSVTWRGRKATIVDASIGQALANVATAQVQLRSYLSKNAAASARDKAAAYDGVLLASQDAADAAKRATDELEKERVDEGDSRMQDLRVTSLAVNYDLISWRVGRNRVLTGEDDGMTLTAQTSKKPKRRRKDGSEYPDKEEPRGRKLARLRERVVLYDASIQSINSVKDLRGAMRDSRFVDELDGKAGYFQALRCLNISYSHSLLGNHLNALALVKRAQDHISQRRPALSPQQDQLLTLDIDSSLFEKLQNHIDSLLTRTHALVQMRKLESDSAKAAEKNRMSATPLVQRLNDFPTPGTHVDLTNLVTYPPKIEPVPVKPLFLDVAFNYIEYPGRPEEVVETAKPSLNGIEQKQAQPEKKKGWFGFGR